jgi:hypothetical protein
VAVDAAAETTGGLRWKGSRMFMNAASAWTGPECCAWSRKYRWHDAYFGDHSKMSKPGLSTHAWGGVDGGGGASKPGGTSVINVGWELGRAVSMVTYMIGEMSIFREWRCIIHAPLQNATMRKNVEGGDVERYINEAPSTQVQALLWICGGAMRNADSVEGLKCDAGKQPLRRSVTPEAAKSSDEATLRLDKQLGLGRCRSRDLRSAECVASPRPRPWARKKGCRPVRPRWLD